MSVFTYEKENRREPLETYEWDRVWHEQTGDTETTRILYIGDSISCNTCRLATERAEGKYLFDGFGTSKGLDNPYFCDSIRLFTAQQSRCDAVIFNNGLHGWHLSDGDQYHNQYERMIQFLQEHFYNVPLYLILTTSVADPERNQRVQQRNTVVQNLAVKYGLSVIDLYSVSAAHPELLTSDGVHYTKDGYKLLAQAICNAVKL